jgi:hypothetical protein
MIRRLCYLIVTMALSSALYAQQSVTAPRDHDVYCAGMVTTVKPPSDTYIISGIGSSIRIAFNQGDLVYINRGAKQGVQVGSQFLVSRPVKEKLEMPWFVWQKSLLSAMGTTYADIGRIRVVHVEPDSSTAQIELFCEQMLRGDIVQPFVPRPAPNYKPVAKLDIFAPAASKEMAMVVTTRGFGETAYAGQVVYVNLGGAQGVKVGDYYRIFRYQGDHHSTVYQTRGQDHSVYGFGSAPGAWQWMDLPREILGEGIVLSVSPNASTVLITDSLREIFAGDYVEVE